MVIFNTSQKFALSKGVSPLFWSNVGSVLKSCFSLGNSKIYCLILFYTEKKTFSTKNPYRIVEKIPFSKGVNPWSCSEIGIFFKNFLLYKTPRYIFDYVLDKKTRLLRLLSMKGKTCNRSSFSRSPKVERNIFSAGIHQRKKCFVELVAVCVLKQ